MRVLWKFTFRQIKSRPGRAFLTLSSIVIGVAALVAVNVGTLTTQKAYQEMYESVAGTAALEVVAQAGGGYDESVIPTLEKVPGVKAVVPLLQRLSILYRNGKKLQFIVMGIDPARPESLRDYQLASGRLFQGDEPEALVEAGFARGLGITAGGEVKFNAGTVQILPVAGTLAPRGAANMNQVGLVFLPLKAVQSLFRQRGTVNVTNLILDENADEKAVLAEVNRRLPEGVIAQPPTARTQLARETMQKAEHGLNFAYQLTLALAIFMILNTFLMNVGERRRQLAVLRAIGTSRNQIIGMLLFEGAMMGVVGTLLGIPIGLGGAYLLTGAMSAAYSGAIPTIRLTVTPFLLAALFGPGLSVIATYIPARLAGKIPPVEGIRPAIASEGSRVPLSYTLSGVVVFLIAGSLLLICTLGYVPVTWAVPAGVVFTAAFVLLLPAALGPLTRLFSFILYPLLHFEGCVAQRQVIRRRTRSTLTIGVLYIAISSGIGLGTTIFNNVQDVRDWHARTIVGDFFLRNLSDSGPRQAVVMPESLGNELRAIEGVDNVDSLSIVGDCKLGEFQVFVAIREFTGNVDLPMDILHGDLKEARQRLFEGEAIVGSVLAQKAGISVGDEITLETRKGPRTVRVAATTTEYMHGGLVIHMERTAGKKLFDIQGVRFFMINALPGAKAAVETRLNKFCEQRGLMLQSFADLRQRLDSMLNGIVGCLWALLALGFVVAGFGIANTLTMNVLEQTRELAMLRVVAMTRRQVQKTILAQAALLGAIGVSTGVIGGVCGAYTTNLCTGPLLGHAVKFSLQPLLLVNCAVVATVVIMIAAWLPAVRASRLNLLIALQYE